MSSFSWHIPVPSTKPSRAPDDLSPGSPGQMSMTSDDFDEVDVQTPSDLQQGDAPTSLTSPASPVIVGPPPQPQSNTNAVSLDILEQLRHIIKESVKEEVQNLHRDVDKTLPARVSPKPRQPDASVSATRPCPQVAEPWTTTLPLASDSTRSSVGLSRPEPVKRFSVQLPLDPKQTARAPAPPSPPSRPTVRFSDREPKKGRLGRTESNSAVPRSDPSVELSPIDQKWGVLFDPQGHTTPRLGAVLRGIANYLIHETSPHGTIVVTPEKLASFYTTYKLDNEVLPLSAIFKSRSKTLHSRVEELYQDLECQYHLVPASHDRTRDRPSVPGLTPAGFVHWTLTLILAYPEQEHARLEKVFLALPINADGPLLDGRPERLPKQLSRRLLPAGYDRKARSLLDTAMKGLMADLLGPGQDAGRQPKSAGTDVPPLPPPLRVTPASMADLRGTRPRQDDHDRAEVQSHRTPTADRTTIPTPSSRRQEEDRDRDRDRDRERERERDRRRYTPEPASKDDRLRLYGKVEVHAPHRAHEQLKRERGLGRTHSAGDTHAVAPAAPPPPAHPMRASTSISRRVRSPQGRHFSASVPEVVPGAAYRPVVAAAGAPAEPDYASPPAGSYDGPGRAFDVAEYRGRGYAGTRDVRPNMIDAAKAAAAAPAGAGAGAGDRRSLVLGQDERGPTWGEILSTGGAGPRTPFSGLGY